MKCYFNLFVIFLFLSTPVFSEEFSAEYTIKTKGVVIGSLFWYLHITPKKYDTSIKLKSQGILSGLYKFNGEAFVENKLMASSEFSAMLVDQGKAK